jgi:hypothetical protein
MTARIENALQKMAKRAGLLGAILLGLIGAPFLGQRGSSQSHMGDDRVYADIPVVYADAPVVSGDDGACDTDSGSGSGSGSGSDCT